MIPNDISLINFSYGWGSGLLLIAIGVAVSILMGIANGKRNFDNDLALDDRERTFLIKLFKSAFKNYLIWGLIQQGIVFLIYLITLSYFHEYAILITASIFALSHFPNPLLVFATWAMSLIFLGHFQIHGNILIPYLGHGIVASFLMLWSPELIHTKFTTWAGYWKIQRKINK